MYFSFKQKGVPLFRNHSKVISIVLLVLALAVLLYLLIESDQRSRQIDKTLRQIPAPQIISH